MQLFDTYLDELHSSESYYGRIIYQIPQFLIIPFINMGVSEHPLNWTEEMYYINKAYMVFTGIESITGYGDIDFSNAPSKHDLEPVYLGGVDLLVQQHKELTIIAHKAFLQTLEDSIIRKEPFYPIFTSYFKANMEEKEVNSFCSNEVIPDNLKMLIDKYQNRINAK